LVPVKNHALLLRAFADLRRRGVGLEWRLQIAGDGPERARLANLGEVLGLGDAVEWIGEVTPAALRRLYRSAAIFALPSKSEAAPLSLMEAMAAGLPVVACRVGGIPEFVRHGIEGLLVAAAEAPTFADALGHYVSHPDQRASAGGAAAKRAAQEFGISRYLEELVGQCDGLGTEACDLGIFHDAH